MVVGRYFFFCFCFVVFLGCNRKSIDVDGFGIERFIVDRCCFFRCGVWFVYFVDLFDVGCCGIDG